MSLPEAGGDGWNSAEHVHRVASGQSRYAAEVQSILAPCIAEQIESWVIPGAEHEPRTIHDLGGYNGLVLDTLRANHLSTAWNMVITDSTRPPAMVDDTAAFHQVPGWDIAGQLGESSVDVTISTNVFHLFDTSQLARTIRAIKTTSKNHGLVVAITPHPLTNGRVWSDITGKTDEQPVITAHRGVFIDDYRDEVTAPHSFVPGATTHPRTIEGFSTLFLNEGFALRAMASLHRPSDAIREREGDRFADTLDRLPSWLMTAWTVSKTNEATR